MEPRPPVSPTQYKHTVALDGVFQVGDGFEETAPDTPSRDGGEKAFDCVQDALHGKFLLFCGEPNQANF
jgi:hypothetical protein